MFQGWGGSAASLCVKRFKYSLLKERARFEFGAEFFIPAGVVFRHKKQLANRATPTNKATHPAMRKDAIPPSSPLVKSAKSPPIQSSVALDLSKEEKVSVQSCHCSFRLQLNSSHFTGFRSMQGYRDQDSFRNKRIERHHRPFKGCDRHEESCEIVHQSWSVGADPVHKFCHLHTSNPPNDEQQRLPSFFPFGQVSRFLSGQVNWNSGPV